MARKLLDSFLREVEFFGSFLYVEPWQHDRRRDTDKALSQTSHKCGNVVVVTVIVPTVVVVPHEIKQKASGLHRWLAILAFNPCNRSGYSTLDKVQASIREIVRPCHRRVWQAEEFLKRFL